jgi:hypothetical protein
MICRFISLLVFCILLLSVVLPANLAFIHTPDNEKMFVTLDVCHVSSPFQPSNANMPFYPEQICGCFLIPGLTGFYKTLQCSFKPPLFASEKENPPRA